MEPAIKQSNPRATAARPNEVVRVTHPPLQSHITEKLSHRDDLDRDVYPVFGIPIDAVDMNKTVDVIEHAIILSRPFLISTPNVNFLMTSRNNRPFREAVLASDLCPPDGMAVVWIARLLGLPICERVAGSDIFDALKRRDHSRSPISVFFLGGKDGVAAEASTKLNLENKQLVCAGFFCPGFGSVEDMSSEETLSKINSSGAEFLIVALGSVKGQEWLRRNHHRVIVPVRAHLGATLNFQASTLRRAPLRLQQLGLEWLWRIKEEPQLWRRYWSDGRRLLWLMLIRILPLAFTTKLQQHRKHRKLHITFHRSTSLGVVALSGDATASEIEIAIPLFRDLLKTNKSLAIDLTEIQFIDARFFGLLLMVRKIINGRGGVLRFVGASRRTRWNFALHDLDFLLAEL